MNCIITSRFSLLRDSISHFLGRLVVTDAMMNCYPADINDLPIILQDSHHLDLVILHTQLDQQGWQEVSSLSRLCMTRLPFVILADFQQEDEMHRATSIGASGCVSTASEWLELTQTIRSIIENDYKAQDGKGSEFSISLS